MTTTPRRGLPHRSLRILVLDASDDEARRLGALLRALEVEVLERVEHAESRLPEALTAFQPDVVLVGDAPPEISGRRVLRRIRRSGPYVPVVLVTGPLAEARRVRLCAAGLSGYVTRPDLGGLGSSVLHAARCAERRRETEAAASRLASESRRFRALADASGDALLVVDAGGSMVYLNAAAERVFGFPATELLGQPVSRLVPEGRRAAHAIGFHSWVAAALGPSPFTAAVDALRADGTEFPVELTVSAWNEDGERFFSAQVRDITARVEAERARRMLSRVVEQTVNSVVVTDVDGVIEYVNPAFEKLTGFSSEEVLGKTPRVVRSGKHSTAFYRRLWGDLKGGRTFRGEFVNRRKDGTEYKERSIIFPFYAEDGRLERLVGIGQDVTQERAVEEALFRTLKLEAMERLAAGIAHDINNALAGVLTSAQLLEMTLPRGEAKALAFAGDVIGAARRGSEHVRRLSNLARHETWSPKVVDVGAVMAEAAKSLKKDSVDAVRIHVERGEGELRCELDEREFYQALLHLAHNSLEAMPGGGDLWFTAGVHDGEGAGSVRPMAVVAVRDSGAGMDAESLSKAFDPFYSTKPLGQALGLGLTAVHAFAQHAGGEIVLESSPGVGTTATLRLPLRGERAESAGAARLTVGIAAGSATSEGAQRSILFATPHAPIQRTAALVLEKEGYRVHRVGTTEEAVGVLEAERGRLELVMLEGILPGAAAALWGRCRAWTERPSFLAVGDAAAGELAREEAMGSFDVLRAPWGARELLASVAAALGARCVR